MGLQGKTAVVVSLVGALLLGLVVVSLLNPRSSTDSESGARATASPNPVVQPGTGGGPSPPGLTDSAVDLPQRLPADPDGIPASLAIAGSVLNRQGERLAGVPLVATPSRVFASDEEERAARLHGRSDADGRYRFDGLTRGDYRIRSESTSRYSATEIKVRAGADQADLVVAPRRSLWVHGLVKAGDEPLAGVRVGPGPASTAVTYTDTDGRFGIQLEDAGDGPAPDSLHLSLDGFHARRIVLRAGDPYAGELALGTIRLERVEGQASVRGTVTAEGAPVTGAPVFLRSTEGGEHYQTATDAAGSFELLRVVVGRYEIAVVAKAGYRDYTDHDVTVGRDGLELRVALEALGYTTVRGRMVDLHGVPVAGLTLWLTSLSARAGGARPVTGDALGWFEVEGFPAGELEFATRSDPRLRITGAAVNGPDDPPLELVLDVGDLAFAGQVVNADSEPVPGARVSLIWSDQRAGISAQALRHMTTDTAGNFRFSGLGPGGHTLTVDAPGHLHHRSEQEAGTAVQIELTAVSH